jgi:hypothetical protein
METPQLPPDLERFERLLAGRERPEPSTDLRERVIRSMEAELLQAELPPQRPNGWWTFAAATAASVVLLLNLSLSAARATSYDLRSADGRQTLLTSVRQIRKLLPELSYREAMRNAVTIQACSNLARCPDVASSAPARRLADLHDCLSKGE